MKTLILVPVILALVVFFFSLWLKTKMPVHTFRKAMLVVAAVFALLSIIFVMVSYSYSQDKTQLAKLSLPGLVLILTVIIYKKTREKKS